ncbi:MULTISPECIES: glycosyltransferase family 2 protein [Dietzia]|uniref:4,4'-diaponeurosporenoate glycosyltransferase n=1 Tax=Dietzia cinnamea TaxID=321318 RepID=A0A4R3ZQV5_9ACTN|nr:MULTISPECIES: glycosyltransferase family 2 protein [Dietzia]MBB1020577.1 glycosyltransferase family 2 protein [Dietzia sp. E1]MBS7547367.1 glycosyltransferase family 2 protein [Dietzia massiliensis]TCW21934.1 glycosyl transferase family 2 [Dietzia cinnamea]
MRISVVIPVLDDARELEGCLAALAAQTRAPDEVVVVDNGCSDDSVAVARAAGARVVDEPVRGIPAAAAAGYDAATGDVIARLDADSRPGPDWLARIESAFAADTELVAVSGPGEFIGLIGWRARAAKLLYMDAFFLSVGSAMAHPVLFGSNLAMRRSAWERVRDGVDRTDPELHDDIDLSFQFGARDRLWVDRSLAVGISARPFDDPAAMRRRFSRAFRTIFRNWRTSPPSQRWLERVQR